MLVAALAATLIGFALLVLALITGVLWLAFTCIGVCAVGVLFLLADTVGIRGPRIAWPRRRRRSSDASTDDAPTTEIPVVVKPPPTLDVDPTEPVDDPVRRGHHGRHERNGGAGRDRADGERPDGEGDAHTVADDPPRDDDRPPASRHRRPD